MPISWEEIKLKAIKFSYDWKDGSSEESEAQPFIADFLEVFGKKIPKKEGKLEYPIHHPADSSLKKIDYFLKHIIAIEMKSRGKDLNIAVSQLFDRYIVNLPENEIPALALVCDFENMWLYRRIMGDQINYSKPIKFKTQNLHKYIKYFGIIVGDTVDSIRDDLMEVNMKAVEKLAKLHDALKNINYDKQDLSLFLVRILFCLFADNSGIFFENNFYSYISKSNPDGSDISLKILTLFDVLNMSNDDRNKNNLLTDELKAFTYINGNLFQGVLHIPYFDAKMRKLLIDCATFDWGKISPAIFGSMFQGVMDKNKRRELGTHYTSEENILKILKPLFLDDLWNEFELVKTIPEKLSRFHDKISKIKFLDPACGCGNFLIVAYRELRILELEVIKMLSKSKDYKLDLSIEIRVDVGQFFGIELESFPCMIAKVGMWLMDHMMNMEASKQFGRYFNRLPLEQGASIVCANALRLDWENVINKHDLSYILGNPPFVGYSNQSKEQKDDILKVCGLGNVDYVSGWYFKAMEYIQNTQIKCAFVSTNSITQGEQVTSIWKPLMKQGAYINFAVPTFKWTNEAKGKAAVHCVIIGFSLIKTEPNINPYLIEAPNIFVQSRSSSLCNVPKMVYGNKPVDGGFLMLTPHERLEIINKHPIAEKYIKRLYGAEEYINNIERFCLWLLDADPAELRQIPEIINRIEKVRQFRLSSKKIATQKFADYPSRFMEVRKPDKDYILIPRVSSENRQYIPIGFVSSEIIVNDSVHIIPEASHYHFGILTSIVHMSWVRTVCGRLKSDYRYSKDIVYNTFPWPETNLKQQSDIQIAALRILSKRQQYPNSSFADLYDKNVMPEDLKKAHENLDRIVMKAYGFNQKTTTEPRIVAALMEKYQALTSQA
jgi:type I restriction-modification system DNA methylase subunit